MACDGCRSVSWRRKSKPGGRHLVCFFLERRKEMGLWCGGQKIEIGGEELEGMKVAEGK